MNESKKFKPELLEKIRGFSLLSTFEFLNLYWKVDVGFSPVKDPRTKLVHVSVGDRVFSLLITGNKWFDSISEVGDGGAIDLTMHLLNIDFVSVVKLLNQNLSRGKF